MQALAASPTVADALATAGVPETQRPAYLEALSDLAATRHDRPGRTGMTVIRRAAGHGPADRPVRVRPRRAHLPDLGAHLRLQPGVRALPVLLGTARPARAVHRRGRGASSTSCSGCRSSTSTSAAASRPCGRTSGTCSTTPSGTTSASSSPPTAWSSTRRAPAQLAAHRLRGRADLPGRRDRRGQRPRARRRLLRHGHAGAGEPGRGRDEGLQGLRRRHPGERRPARRVQGAHRLLRRAAADHPAAPVRPRRRRLGRAAPDARHSSASCTTGCWPTARRCSPATRSSTCRPSARHCPG